MFGNFAFILDWKKKQTVNTSFEMKMEIETTPGWESAFKINKALLLMFSFEVKYFVLTSAFL